MQLQQNDEECSARLRTVLAVCWAQACLQPHHICSSTFPQLPLLSSTHLATSAQPCFIRLNCASIRSTGRTIPPLQKGDPEGYHYSKLAWRPVKVSHSLLKSVYVPLRKLMVLSCHAQNFCPNTENLPFSLIWFPPQGPRSQPDLKQLPEAGGRPGNSIIVTLVLSSQGSEGRESWPSTKVLNNKITNTCKKWTRQS